MIFGDCNVNDSLGNFFDGEVVDGTAWGIL